MIRIKDTSLKTKLILIIFGIALASQLITFTILSIERYSYLKNELIQQSHIQAKLIGDYSLSPLIFEDMDGLNDILAKIETIPIILAASVYDAKGELIASNSVVEEIVIDKHEEHATINLKNMLHIKEEINHDGVSYGSIHLIVSTTLLDKSFYSQVMMLLIIVVVMGFIIYIFASWLQRLISKPILNLAETAKNIAQQGNYSLKLDMDGSDEISQLYNSFNHMMKKIEERSSERDKALEIVQEQYERFLSILNSFPQVIYVVDPKTYEILFVNTTLKKMYDYELVGKKCYEAFHHNSERCSFCKMIDLQEVGDEIVWEHHNTFMNRYYLVLDKLIKWPDDKIVSMEVAIDITKRKENEEELIKHREHLEDLVKERTIELETQNSELERFNKLFVGGEFRIKELREKLKKYKRLNDQ